jgi:hypothetical protein
LIKYSENLEQILDSVKRRFSIDFILKIFDLTSFGDCSLLNSISQFGENLPKILKWMRLNLSYDLKFLEQQLFWIQSSSLVSSERGILHNAFKFLSNEVLFNLFDEIENWG